MLEKAALFFALSLVAQLAHGAIINVNAIPGAAGCTLVDAINSANDNSGVGGCTAGLGDDTIVISATLGEHVFTTVDNNQNALPTITTNIYIRGENGQPELRRSGSQSMRFFDVESTGVLTVENMRLTEGRTDFSANSFFSSGGAVRVAEDGVLFVFDSLMDSNISGGFGGAIGSVGGQIVIFNSQLQFNRARGFGGGVRLTTGGSNIGKLTVAESTIANNTLETLGLQAAGGGISVNNTELEVTDSRISGNFSPGSSGGISIVQTKTSILRSLIYSNLATDQVSTTSTIVGYGGGLGISGGEAIVNVYDSTISTNKSSQGAGVRIFGGDGGEVNFVNTTIAYNALNPLNSNPNGIGGVYITLDSDSTTKVVFRNSIISGNYLESPVGPKEIFAILDQQNSLTFSYSLIGHSAINRVGAVSDASGSYAILFEPPGSNIFATSDGPAGETIPTPLGQAISPISVPNVIKKYHALPDNSPAINAGTDGFVAASGLFNFWFPGCRGEKTDFYTGSPPPYRKDYIETPRKQGAACDIGAVEYRETDCFVIADAEGNVISFCL